MSVRETPSVIPASLPSIRRNGASTHGHRLAGSPRSIHKRWAAGLAFVSLAACLGGCPSSSADLGDGGGAGAGAPAASARDAAGSGTGSATGGAANSSAGSAGVASDPNPTPSTVPSNQPPSAVPGGPLAIVTLGDSLTEGSGDESDAGGGYPFRLANAVEARRPGSTVLNVGHSGWTSTDLIRGFDGAPSELEQAIAAKPDIACVWIGGNDLWRLYTDGPEEGTPPEMEAANLAVFAANIDTILSRLRAAGAAVYIGLSDDQSLRPAAGTALWGISQAELAQMSKQVVRYNNVIIAAAQRHSATVVDFYNTTIFTTEAMLDADGIHPNAAGYDQIAALWLAAINPAIR